MKKADTEDMMSSTGASDVQMSDCAGTIVKVRGSLQSEGAGDRGKEHDKNAERKGTLRHRYTPTGLVPSVCFPMSPATLPVGVQPEDRHREIKAGTV